MQEFHRISRLPPYVFNIVNDLKAKARAAGEDIIDFGWEIQINRRLNILSIN